MVSFSGTVQSDYLKYLPTELDNKAKLIDFAAGDFASYREALINYVKATFPLDYNNFESSDFGVMLIELMAAVGHIQSSKADYLANENFLSTARSRDSVKRMLELIGVRMKGPISAAANAQIELPGLSDTVSSITITGANRSISINSPEDGGALTYTLYRMNSNGLIDGLGEDTADITVEIDAFEGAYVASGLVLQEGALVQETGTFRSADRVQEISLAQAPYIEKSAQVYIAGSLETEGSYTEEDNIYFASGGTDKVFQVTTDENFRASLLFGDNSVGRSPAIGDAYRVLYRIGGGERGNIANSFINAPIDVTANFIGGGTSPIQGTLENTSIGTGGRNAETVESAKRYGPLFFRSQDRLVTLEDYKGHANRFASNYGSTGKAAAVVRRAYSSANIIDLFVLEKASNTQLRRATQEYKKQLLESITPKKMLTDEVVVVDGLIRTMDLFLVLTLDSNFKSGQNQIIQSARELTQKYFNVDNTDFGEPFVPQDLIRYILDNETNIRYARVDNVESPISVGFNEVIQLNNLNITVSFV